MCHLPFLLSECAACGGEERETTHSLTIVVSQSVIIMEEGVEAYRLADRKARRESGREGGREGDGKKRAIPAALFRCLHRLCRSGKIKGRGQAGIVEQ